MTDEVGGGGGGVGSSRRGESTACSICFDPVVHGGFRATARLNCLHEFHLDCIGSAFNSKRVMQCPNCREIEDGNWICSRSGYSTRELYSQNEDSNNLGFETTLDSNLIRIQRFDQGSLDSEAAANNTYSDSSTYSSNFGGMAFRTITSVCPYMSYIQPIPFEGRSDPHQENHVVGAETIQTSNAILRQGGSSDLFWGNPFISARPSHRTNNSSQPTTYSTMMSRSYDADNHLQTSMSTYPQLMHGLPPEPRLIGISSLVMPNHENSMYLIYGPQYSDVNTRSSDPIRPASYNGNAAPNGSGYYFVPHFGSWVHQDMIVGHGQGRWGGHRGAPFPLMDADRTGARQGSSFHSSSSSGSGRAHRNDEMS